MAKKENKFIRFGFFECCFICDTDDVSKKSRNLLNHVNQKIKKELKPLQNY